MNGVLLILAIILTKSKATFFDDNEFPDINHIFVMQDNNTYPFQNLPNVLVKKTMVDLETINVTKYWNQLNKYRHHMKENMPRIIEEFENPYSNSFNETRRQVIRWDWWHTPEYREGSLQVTKLKTLDLMLQLIYMARHRLREMEDSQYFQRTDTGYRIAFLYRRLRRIFRRMMDIYTTMANNREKWARQEWQLTLHTKATKLHVDFLYLWWVLIRVDEKYNVRNEFVPTLPSWIYLPKPTTRPPRPPPSHPP